MTLADPNADKPIIWLVNTTFEPRGSAVYTLRLARILPELGFHPVIICESDRYIPTRLRTKLDIRVVPGLRRRFWGPIVLSKLIHETDEPPALVHSQRVGLERVGSLLADSFDCPHLLTVHNFIEERTEISLAPGDVTAMIAISPSIQQALVRQGVIAERMVRVIPTGVDVSEMPRIPATRKVEKIPVVGTASVLEPSKGLIFLLMAAELILSSGHDVEFIIAGNGPDEETLRLVAQQLEISNRVTFATHATSFVPIIETFDVFVLPSLEQGLGTIMLEAMALNKPVVATRVGGVADFFIDGEHALLVDKENHIVLADKIEMLLDFPEKARKLALAGQDFVRSRFTAERMVTDTAAFYREILAPAVVSS